MELDLTLTLYQGEVLLLDPRRRSNMVIFKSTLQPPLAALLSLRSIAELDEQRGCCGVELHGCFVSRAEAEVDPPSVVGRL